MDDITYEIRIKKGHAKKTRPAREEPCGIVSRKDMPD
jgi:hypothetical protein